MRSTLRYKENCAPALNEQESREDVWSMGGRCLR